VIILTVLRDFSILWAMIHTLILFLFLFESRYPKKKTMAITLFTMIPLTIINLFLFVILGFEKYGTLMLVTLSLPSFIIFWFMAKNRDGRFYFTFCMVDTVILELVYITNILNHYLTPDTFFVMFFTRLIACPVLTLLVWKKLRPVYINIQRQVPKGWGIFAVIGCLFYISITLLMTHPDSIVNRPEHLPTLSILFVLMPIIYIHIITTLNNQQKYHEQAEQENIMKLQVHNIIARVEELGEANEAFRKERHDFRHKLKAIASLVETKQFDELAKIVAEYEDNIVKTQSVRYAKSAIIDAVLSVYIRKAKHAGIDLKLGFAFPDKFEASESELATALANAIENAINACEKLPEEQRSIEIKVLSKPKFMIMIRNSFNGNVEFDSDGIPINYEEGHGLGSRSIAAFCTKVGGYYEFSATDNIFTLFMHLK